MVGGLHSNNTGAQAASITATDGIGSPSGTVNSGVDIADNSTMTVMGYVADLTAGVNNFTFTETGSGGNKQAFVAAVFSPPGPPSITSQPQPQMLYAGGTARFFVSAIGFSPTYQWYKDSAPLADGPTGTGSIISGATSTNLVISNVGAADMAGYSVQVTDTRGMTPSSSATLTIVTPTGEAYESALLAAKPAVFYPLNETGDPSTGNTVAFDYIGGFNALYGTASQNGFNGVAGPRPSDGFPGFGAANAAVNFNSGNPTSTDRITVRTPWGLNTNTVTITAWINPAVGYQNPNAAIVLCRGGDTVAGLTYSPTNDVFGNRTLGYTWDREYETYSWDSGIAPPVGVWSFVALAITPTNATLHVMNTSGLVSASHAYPHVVQSFGAGTQTLIGDDPSDPSFVQIFLGEVDDVAVFNSALTKDQLTALFTAASGVAHYPPAIAGQPVSLSLYQGQTAQLKVAAGGTDPLTYHWKSGPSGGPYSNLSDGGRISGSSTPTLVISNVTASDASLDYLVMVSNPSGSTNSAVANLFVQPPGQAQSITMHAIQPTGANWDTGAYWSDGNPASLSAVSFPGSTYELLASDGLNTRMRTPETPTMAVFPGDLLTVDGNAIWTNNPATNGAIAEIRFKQPTSPSGVPGQVYFKKLVMNGGQLDAGNDGMVVIQGEMDILTNAPIYSDSANDRGFRVDARLVGGPSSSIEYHGYNQTTFQPGYVNNLNITGTSNAFSGKWFVPIGTLLATGFGALGTNDIVIGSNAAFQATYDLNNSNADLYLSGRMYLNQNHTFKSVHVGVVPLAAGNHSFAELTAAYPTNFPATWTPQAGAETYTNASGSIRVLVTPTPEITQQPVSLALYPTENAAFAVQVPTPPPLSFQWRKDGAALTDGGGVAGAATANLTVTGVTAGNGGSYDVVVTNSSGAVTSAPATLTILANVQSLSLDYGGAPIIQGNGSNWNTINSWTDGKPASESAPVNPGCVYHVVPGALLRTPDGVSASAFPGGMLSVEGDGVWSNGSPTIGEVRFKPAFGGSVYFPKLVMNGGQLDAGLTDNGSVAVTGEIDILANTPFYNDSANDRGFQIGALLTGSGNIEYHGYSGTGFNPTHLHNLNVTGTSNTFSGTWSVVQGVLLGSGANSLGTNAITVGAQGALETTYDLNNPQGTLTLDGKMFLHQNDTFQAVTIGGVPLAVGTHTFAELTASYPGNFPSSWTLQLGSTVSSGSGSLTVVGTGPAQVPLELEYTGGNLKLSWSQGILLEAPSLNGPWTTNAAPSPYTVTPSPVVPAKFYRVQVR